MGEAGIELRMIFVRTVMAVVRWGTLGIVMAVVRWEGWGMWIGGI